MKTILLSLTLAVVASTSQAADTFTPPQRLAAYSKTAMAITGDVILEETIIRFANGESLAWQPVYEDKGNNVYEVVSARNPVLLNGNTLCGEAPITRVATSEQGDKVRLSVFDETNNEPADVLASSENLCAVFYYTTQGN